jgi:hypothetical protein
MDYIMLIKTCNNTYIFTQITTKHLTKYQVFRDKAVHEADKTNITDVAVIVVLRQEERTLYDNREPR